MIVALLGSARFFLALAGMDVGTSFGGIGASREVMIASLAEPGMIMVVFTLALLAGSAADDAKDKSDDVKVDDVKATDGGEAEKFKGKEFDLKDKGKAGLTLSFPADKKATVTVKSDKKTDVNLYVFDADKKVVVKRFEVDAISVPGIRKEYRGETVPSELHAPVPACPAPCPAGCPAH